MVIYSSRPLFRERFFAIFYYFQKISCCSTQFASRQHFKEPLYCQHFNGSGKLFNHPYITVQHPCCPITWKTLANRSLVSWAISTLINASINSDKKTSKNHHHNIAKSYLFFNHHPASHFFEVGNLSMAKFVGNLPMMICLKSTFLQLVNVCFYYKYSC